MSLPVTTTTITVWRVEADPERDPLDPKPAAEAVYESVPAVISQSRRQENPAGSQEVAYFRLACEAIDLLSDDEVEDEKTAERYRVIGPRLVKGIGAVSDYVRADMRQVEGMAGNPREARI